MAGVLSSEDRAHFDARGFVRVPSAFGAGFAHEHRELLWRELKEAFGIRRDDRGTWRQPERDLKWAKTDSSQQKIATERLLGAIRELGGDDVWGPPGHWGRVLVTFPEPVGTAWTLPTGPWHWDSELADNVGPPKRLVIFTFFSEVKPQGGGTLLVSGSHELLRTFHDELSARERRAEHRTLRRRFLRWDGWLERLTGSSPLPDGHERLDYFMSAPREVRGIELRIEELSGSPGDAVLCHPLMVHTSSPNCRDAPRFMRIRFPGG